MADTTVKIVSVPYWSGNTLVPAGTILGASDSKVRTPHTKDVVIKSTS